MDLFSMVGKILIIDSVMTNRVILKVKLSGAGYSAHVAATGTEGLQIAGHFVPDLIVLDMDLPDMTAPLVMEKLRGDMRLSNVMVIMVSTRNDPATRMAAYRAGCDEFMAKPIVEQSLLTRIRNFMRKDDQLKHLGLAYDGYALFGFSEKIEEFLLPARITLVAPQTDITAILRRNLQKYLNQPIDCMAAENVLTKARDEVVETDLIAITSDPANPTAALRLMSELRSHPKTRDAAYCLFYSTDQESQDSDIAYDLGADAVIETHIGPEEAALRLSRLICRKRLADQTRDHIQNSLQMAMVDPLTGLFNRRYCMAQLGHIVADSAVTGSSFAVMVLDIDRFKSVNDRWGHAAGDAVLCELARRLTGSVRQGDLLARIGGEEFVVALPNCAIGEARNIAERLRFAVKDMVFNLPNNQTANITISIGLTMAISSGAHETESMVELALSAADEALMVSKSEGRNKITLGRSAA
jgi:two-component system cell cycle response regulator